MTKNRKIPGIKGHEAIKNLNKELLKPDRDQYFQNSLPPDKEVKSLK